MTTRKRTVIALGMAVVVVALLAVACGDEEEGPAATPPAAVQETPEGPPPVEAGELPSIPVYPGAEEIYSGTFTGAGDFPVPIADDGGLEPEDYGTVQYTTYEISDSPEKVLDFYKREFEGWEEEGTFAVEELRRKGEVVVWSKDNENIAVWLSAWEARHREGTTEIIVAVGVRR
jgi:hypothetical protein